MAAPIRQLSCLVLSRIFLPKTPAYNSFLAQNYVFRLSCVRQKSLSSIKMVNLRSGKVLLIKAFCTEKSNAEISTKPRSRSTTSSISTSKGATRDLGPSSLDDDDESTADSGLKSETGIPRETLQEHHGNEGDIKIRSESLYDLASDLEGAIDSQHNQLENKHFYRRRVESEWSPGNTFRGYQERDSGSDEFMNDSPYAAANRKHDPTYFYGFASVLCCSVLVALALFKKKDQEDTIELLIVKSWVSEREGDLVKAEEILHKALHMAQDKNNVDAVTYIYDQLANLAMRHGNLTRAEGLFKETLKRMISSGTAQDDSAVIEISLKLARMYDKMRRYDDAEQGFRWCIATTEKKLAQTKDKETSQNLQSLLGMCLDCYARSLAAHDRLQEAKDTYKRALVICENELMIDGLPHPQTVILLNDLGTVCDLGGQYNEAIEFIQRAADLAEKRSPSDLPTVLCNLASVQMHAERFEEARSHYKRALSQAERQSDATAILKIKNSLAQLQTNEFLKAQKKSVQGNKKIEEQKS